MGDADCGWSVGTEQAKYDASQRAKTESKTPRLAQGGSILLCLHFEGAVLEVGRKVLIVVKPAQKIAMPRFSLHSGQSSRSFAVQNFFYFFIKSSYFWTVFFMMWTQHDLRLPPRPRGFHLITSAIEAAVPELTQVQIGLLHCFLQHTSASLTINENANADVRVDFETAMNHVVPDDLAYVHTLEGPDDMPAHIKASMMGASVMIPVRDGRLRMGTWQGIYLCEHRDHASARHLVLTLQGSTLA